MMHSISPLSTLYRREEKREQKKDTNSQISKVIRPVLQDFSQDAGVFPEQSQSSNLYGKRNRVLHGPDLEKPENNENIKEPLRESSNGIWVSLEHSFSGFRQNANVPSSPSLFPRAVNDVQSTQNEQTEVSQRNNEDQNTDNEQDFPFEGHSQALSIENRGGLKGELLSQNLTLTQENLEERSLHPTKEKSASALLEQCSSLSGETTEASEDDDWEVSKEEALVNRCLQRKQSLPGNASSVQEYSLGRLESFYELNQEKLSSFCPSEKNSSFIFKDRNNGGISKGVVLNSTQDSLGGRIASGKSSNESSKEISEECQDLGGIFEWDS